MCLTVWMPFSTGQVTFTFALRLKVDSQCTDKGIFDEDAYASSHKSNSFCRILMTPTRTVTSAYAPS